MPQVKTPWGTMPIPDGYEPDDIQGALDDFAYEQAQMKQNPPIVNALKSTFGNAMGGGDIGPSDFMPNLPSASSMFGMTPEQVGRVSQVSQNAHVQSASEKIRQRVANERLIEAEKERKQQFQLEKMRHDNDVAEADYRHKLDLDVEDYKKRAGWTEKDSTGAIWYLWEDENGQVKKQPIVDGKKDPFYGTKSVPGVGVVSMGDDGKAAVIPGTEPKEKPPRGVWDAIRGVWVMPDGTFIKPEGLPERPKTASDKITYRAIHAGMTSLRDADARAFRPAKTEEEYYAQTMENLEKQIAGAATLQGGAPAAIAAPAPAPTGNIIVRPDGTRIELVD